MAFISRARHVGFDWKGRPIVRQLNDVTCADTIPDSLGLRHVSWTQQGDPLLAYAWGCCDGYCTDAEIAGGTCYIDPTGWPLGPGPGITKRMGVFIQDVQSCFSANELRGLLNWSSGTSWTNTFVLRNCTLTLTVTEHTFPNPLDPTNPDPTNPSKFTLTWSGSTGDSGSVDAAPGCTDPLLVNFGNVLLPKCCQCPGSGTGTTDSGATINVWITANCRYIKWGRHSGWYYNSSAKPVPVVATPRNCDWDHVDPDGCSVMTCPLNATITSAVCSCLAGSWTMDYASGQWENINVGTGCLAPATVRLSCSAAGKDADGNTLVKLQCDVICGVTNTGSATATVLASSLENLDETFAITMGDATPPDPNACCAAGSTLSVRFTRA